MKTLFKAALTIMMAAVVTTAIAQPGQRGERMSSEEMARRYSERMAEQLNLDAAQKQRVYDIQLDHLKAMEAQRPERPERKARNVRTGMNENENVTSMERAQLKAEMEEQRESINAMLAEVDAKMKEVLTEDQYLKWVQDVNQYDHMGRTKPQGNRRGARR